MRGGRRRTRAAARGVIAVGAIAALASCIGSTSRDDFDAEVQARGGGISQDLVLEAVDAAQQELGGDPIQVVSLTIGPGHVSLQVRVPGTVEDLDLYGYGSSGMYGGRGLSGREPIPNEESLEGDLFVPDRTVLARLDEMVDTALAEAAIDGGYAEGASIRRSATTNDVETSITVKNERRTVHVTFGPDGSVREVGQ